MTLTRRHFLHIGMYGAAAVLIPPVPSALTPQTLRIALLHLAPLPGDLTYNRRLVETAVTTAARAGADWILTPELCICGYTFADRIGTAWIVPQPDPWMTHFCRLVRRLHTTVFLSHPERDWQTAKLYNTVFVITAEGAIVGKYRKLNTLRVGSEAWSSPGEQIASIPVPPLSLVGILICADASSPEIARRYQAQGAQLLVSSAAWAPGLHGPSGEWERCTRETGLPLIVCNRTGADRILDFTAAESVIVKDGQRIRSFRSGRSAIFLLEWDLQAQTVVRQEYQRVEL
jgi:omega-amidase